MGFALARPGKVGLSKLGGGAVSGPTGGTLLLMHFEGADGGTTFVDSSNYSRAVVWCGNTTPTTSTTQKKFGSSSGKFVSANAQGLSIAEGATSVLSADFCIEGWFWPTSVGNSNESIISLGALGGNTNHCLIYLAIGTGKLIFYDKVAGSAWITSTAAPSAGSFHHMAIERVGSTVTMYIDGTATGTPYSGANSTRTFGKAGAVTLIGLENTTGSTLANGMMDLTGGWVDEIRVSSVARYNGNFTPPTGAFTAD